MLLLNMYKDHYSQRSKTPIDFIHALELEDLRLTVPEFKEIVDKYIEYALSEYDCNLFLTDHDTLWISTFSQTHLGIFTKRIYAQC